MQDNVCLVIDLEGFHVQGAFQPRELGYHSWQGDAGRQAFFQRVEYRDLCAKDRRTVGVVRRKIHGLSYQPSEAEDPTHPRNLRGLLRRLYREFATEHRTVVAYKGGTVEKTTLVELGVTRFEFGIVGVPQVRRAPRTRPTPRPARGLVTQLRVSRRSHPPSLPRDRMSRLLVVVPTRHESRLKARELFFFYCNKGMLLRCH